MKIIPSIAPNQLKILGIIGFGKEGEAVYNVYKNQFDKVYVFDENLKSINIQDPKITLFNSLKIPKQVNFLVKSPGIALHKITLENSKSKINGLISLLFQKLDMSKVVAVTGTKGKSTVSSLIKHILKTNNKKVELLGNIGIINTKLFENYEPDKYYIFELSSFQCQQLELSPHIAIWTNLYIDHQDVHLDMDEYTKSKANICKFQTNLDYFITIPKLETTFTKATKIIIDKPDLFETKLLGNHNQLNCQFAFETCLKIGLNSEQILNSIKTFEPIKGRLEKINQVIINHNLIEFYTDDLATIPEATWQAILAFDGGVKTLITGGYDKGSDYSELSSNLATSKIQNIIYFNPTGAKIISKIDPTKINLHEAKSMKQAVYLAFQLTNKGICLLSCASASFGMFIDSTDRGNQYKNEVAWNITNLKT